jgi:hypothetical protein
MLFLYERWRARLGSIGKHMTLHAHVASLSIRPLIKLRAEQLT